MPAREKPTFAPASAYSKFDANGRLVGRFMIPAPAKSSDRLLVIGFGRDKVLANRLDDEGAVHLTIYPIVPVQ